MPLFRHTCEVGAPVHSRKTVRNRARTSFQCFQTVEVPSYTYKTVRIAYQRKNPISAMLFFLAKKIVLTSQHAANCLI